MSNFINLDNIEDDAIDPKSIGGVSGVPSAPIAGVDVAKQAAPSAGMSMDLMLLKHQKQVFLFDTSGSMGSPLKFSKNIDDYANVEYTIDICLLPIFRNPSTLLRQNTTGHPLYLHVTDLHATKEVEPTVESIYARLKTDEFLVELCATENFLWTPSELDDRFIEKFKTRLQVVQSSLIKVIRKRYADNPDADMVAAYFDDNVHPIQASTIDELEKSIANSPKGGGTSIMSAVNYGLNVCSKFPSKIGMNRLILVTDCEDGGFDVTAMHDRFKSSRAMLDVIQISKRELGCARELRRLCQLTGGDYITVDSAEEFETKFIGVAERLMLTTSQL
jgi:hypothetical protein